MFEADAVSGGGCKGRAARPAGSSRRRGRRGDLFVGKIRVVWFFAGAADTTGNATFQEVGHGGNECGKTAFIHQADAHEDFAGNVGGVLPPLLFRRALSLWDRLGHWRNKMLWRLSQCARHDEKMVVNFFETRYCA